MKRTEERKKEPESDGEHRGAKKSQARRSTAKTGENVAHPRENDQPLHRAGRKAQKEAETVRHAIKSQQQWDQRNKRRRRDGSLWKGDAEENPRGNGEENTRERGWPERPSRRGPSVQTQGLTMNGLNFS